MARRPQRLIDIADQSVARAEAYSRSWRETRRPLSEGLAGARECRTVAAQMHLYRPSLPAAPAISRLAPLAVPLPTDTDKREGWKIRPDHEMKLRQLRDRVTSLRQRIQIKSIERHVFVNRK
jgi:hypothetical protein